MNALRKVWVRFLIALIGGSVIHEVIFISTGDPNRLPSANDHSLPVLYMAMIYLGLTLMVRINKKNDLN